MVRAHLRNLTAQPLLGSLELGLGLRDSAFASYGLSTAADDETPAGSLVRRKLKLRSVCCARLFNPLPRKVQYFLVKSSGEFLNLKGLPLRLPGFFGAHRLFERQLDYRFLRGQIDVRLLRARAACAHGDQHGRGRQQMESSNASLQNLWLATHAHSIQYCVNGFWLILALLTVSGH